MPLFKNKYRIESTRAPFWDYTSAGWYFVTLCTHRRKNHFGAVVNGAMHHSAIGEIVAEEWQKTVTVRAGVALDEWIVMPNHLHGIIVIEKASEVGCRQPTRIASSASLTSRAIGAIIGQIKSVCTKRIRTSGYYDLIWQPGFFDHIIRNEQALDQIRQYIVDNPAKWELDKDRISNLWM